MGSWADTLESVVRREEQQDLFPWAAAAFKPTDAEKQLMQGQEMETHYSPFGYH